ncbi:putative GTP-binding protein 6 [Dermacentor albipictus]|uniref:putative GTP-binding protein 6 n=1 Tax=Dermacentor albipictus TaxID=60249 RepID=UPI0031FE1F6F
MVTLPNISFLARHVGCYAATMLHLCSVRQFFSLALRSKLCVYRKHSSLITLRTSFTEIDYVEFENFVQCSSYVEQQPKFALLNLPRVGHDVLVVQPRIKKGRRLRTDTTTALQLAEAVTLLETLPGWKAAGRLTLKTDNDMRKLLFKSGNLEIIQDSVKEKSATAIFINVDILTGVQHVALQEFFRLPIYDRYTVVLNIFRNHARTKEAKLQIALAEIPYYRARIWHLHKGTGRNMSGTGQTYYERQQQLLRSREAALRRQLGELTGERSLLRKKRRQLEFPTVAVVGYTNAGKTALIKQLTNDDRLQPRDQFFATIDVTAHAGRLNMLKRVLYMDTVGFISDIPTTLVASFASTLEDVVLADVIVHVVDLSHPDRDAQRNNVLQTLENIGVPPKLLDSVIEVGNKIDLLPSSLTDSRWEYMPISCVDGTGLAELRILIEQRLIKNTGRSVERFRVPTGGSEYIWLYREGTFISCTVDSCDSNYSIVDVVLTTATKAKFKHLFGSTCSVE